MIQNLKKLRVEKGISQKALGEKIGVSQQSINKYENYAIEPDIKTLILIAQFFQTSVDYLIGNTAVRRVIEVTSTFELNEDEAKLLEGYRLLSRAEKESIHLVIHNYNSRS